MKGLFDPIRQCDVPDLPEERVRQSLISQMLLLGYPKALIAVEKDLKHLSHIRSFPAEKRRADILCFGKNIHPRFPLFPLIMIECKAIPLTQKAIDQVMGYNHYIQAFFVAIANEDEIRTLWFDTVKKEYQSLNFLPPYEQLIAAVKNVVHQNSTIDAEKN